MAFGYTEQYFGCAGQHGQSQVSPKTRKFSCAYLSARDETPRRRAIVPGRKMCLNQWRTNTFCEQM